MHNKTWLRHLFLVSFLLLAFTRANSQDSSKRVIENADTSRFNTDKESSWVLFNSYVGRYTPDTVTFEFIIQNGRKSIDWKEPQYIGKIKDTGLLPATEQLIEYFLLENSYIVRITEKGDCYINLNKGFLPPTDPVIIPVQVRYPYRQAVKQEDVKQQD